ncbi:MAG: phosphoribosylformimino-5-aminoimidazole carboxamide ribotide isomerase [Lachnospiraceae bacterium]|nr:phosphoribosylformimino-5-aminoimidazole carboxamide ribotide isomerase [Lachnospiraceae bacterium]
MRFRPCIDVHNGKVKQIVGNSLRDSGNFAKDNFVSEKGAGYYASLYRERGLSGGHVIILNPAGSEYYEEDLSQAREALAAYPGGLMLGGGVNADNAASFIEMGASHVIVTSYVFRDGEVDLERLEKLKKAVGREYIVLDLSCRKKDGRYYIVTDRWQKFTVQQVNSDTMDMLAPYCDEFLVHAVDAEGKGAGIDTEIAAILGAWGKCPVTYAGGIGSREDLEALRVSGKGKLDFTIGSALDIFGGTIPFEWAASFKE